MIFAFCAQADEHVLSRRVCHRPQTMQRFASSPYTLAGGYTRPIHTPHKALPLNTRVHSKAAGEEETDGFALAPQTMQAAFRTTGIVGAVEPGEQREATRFVPRHAQ
jgi:hypothetical protein